MKTLNKTLWVILAVMITLTTSCKKDKIAPEPEPSMAGFSLLSNLKTNPQDL